MSNMSYCRFRNTVEALEDCYEALNDFEDMEDLSNEEEYAKEELFKLCQKIVDEN